jgi:hypothetical protein
MMLFPLCGGGGIDFYQLAAEPLSVKAVGGRSASTIAGCVNVSIRSTAVGDVNHFGTGQRLIPSTAGNGMDVLQRRRHRILRSLEVVTGTAHRTAVVLSAVPANQAMLSESLDFSFTSC